ncbi:MAG: hypothetical protein WCE21_04255 [Candidatus Babeliales bacterium]
MNNTTRKNTSSTKATLPSVKSYSEIVEFLDSRWQAQPKKDLTAFKELDKALGSPSKATPLIAIAGTNGKGLTVNFTASLFHKEGLKVGAFYCPRVLTYNEQFALNNELIANKTFADLANEVINTALVQDIAISSHEIIAMTALLYFKEQKADVGIVELMHGSLDPLTIATPKILAITRVTDDVIPANEQKTDDIIKDLIKNIKSETFVVSADQSKAHLQLMQEETKKNGGTWAMPIRKLAPLGYPFEQLHGRCAALAERIGQVFVENFVHADSLILENSFLAKQKGQRGRPTLEAKRHAELNPKKTIDQFWQETIATLPARFQVLEKEKPTILLDPSPNVDALKNLLLGVRLLNYQRPLKGIAFIFACDKKQMHVEEFLRQLRYFSKKNSAQIVFTPINETIPGVFEETWDIEQIAHEVKAYKIKARTAQTFQEAFETAKQLVDERNGLVVIAGSHAIIADYWRSKGMKKL